MRILAALPILLLAALVPAETVFGAEAAGRVLLAAGDVTATREGRLVRLERGAVIEARDVLRTGRESSLQVRMNDEAIIALKSDSALSVEQYTFRGQTDGSENAVFRLLKGGFRTITGLIGRVNKNAYRVNTGVATIGIRGTAFALALCEDGSCREGSGAAAKDGLYGAVTEGQINATNKAAEATFSAGQAFYAAAPDAGFQQLLTPPTFLGERLDGQRRNVNEPRRQQEESDPNEPRGPRRDRLRDNMTAQTAEKKASAEGSTDSPKPGTGSPTTDTTSTTAADAGTKGSILTGTGLLPILKAEILSGTGTTTVLPAPDGFLAAFAHPGAYEIHFGDGAQAKFNDANQLVNWTKGSSGGFLGLGDVVARGGIARDGQVLTWGRWNGGTVTTSSGNTIHGIPLLFVTANAVNSNSFQASLPSLGVVTYGGAVGPGPAGVRAGYLPNQIFGSIVSESLTIDFGQAQAHLAMDIRLGSAGNALNPAFDHTYSFSASIGPAANSGSGDFSGTFAGICTAGCSSTSISGKVDIGLTGKGGYGLAVTAGGFTDSSSTLSATFVRIFEAAPVGSTNNTVSATAVAQ